MKQHTKGAYLDKIRELAASYVPEWHFTTQDPDIGSVAAMLVGDMLQDNAARYDAVLRKHRIQYLNLFDRYKEEPIESAKTYVRFDMVPGVSEPALVPKGTQVLAGAGEDGRQAVFETAFGITAAATAIEAAYAVNGQEDRIVRQFVSGGGATAENCVFTAFDVSGDNLAHHIFHMGFRDVFDGLASLDLRLLLQSPREEEQEALARALLEPGIRIALVDGQDGAGGYLYQNFDLVEAEGAALHLVMADARPRTVPAAGGEYYLLAILSEKPTPLEISGAKLWFSADDLPATEVVGRGIPQNPHHFHPFGVPMEIYAQCELETEALQRRGAQVEMRFQLRYEVVEQLLPEYEEDTEYKVIMKKPPTRSKPKVSEVRCDHVLLEYLGQGGWKRLLEDEEAQALFGGTREGPVRLAFTVPDDILERQAAGGPRLRLRLARAENLYQIPCRQYCPVMEDLRFSYSYEVAPRQPEVAYTHNNFVEANILPQLERERPTRLFVSVEHPGTAQYLGFSGSPHGTPLSLFFLLGDTLESPVDFTVEYYAGDGFKSIKAVDMTAGMIYSEAMLLIVPRDIAPCTLFGRQQYWLRFVSSLGGRAPESLPVVRGIYLNMTRAENVNTHTEHFYLDAPDAATRIALGERGLISAKVWVNEAGKDGENWVLWQKSTHREHQGRVYDLDLAAGELSFAKGCFSSYPVREDGPAIRVEYQSYLGSAANVPAGSLGMLASSIRHISGVRNPFPAYGGYDGYNEETSAGIISNLLRTRGRAVSRRDYFDMISSVSYSVRRIKVLSGTGKDGERMPDTITIALLIDEYDQGGHIFSAVRQTVEQKLLSSTNLVPMGKTLLVCQPHFVRISVRLWMECLHMEGAYDVQTACAGSIRRFLDPLEGGFNGRGWEIGVLPTRSQLLAYLKIHHEDAVVARMVMTARLGGREFEVGDAPQRQVASPLAMAVNGEHIVYVELAQS